MSIEQIILQKLHELPLEKQYQVLAFVDSLFMGSEPDLIEELLENPLEPISNPEPFARIELYDRK
jgi:hypothetical protein